MLPNANQSVKVAVLGGGITGLAAAFYLLRAGADVTVIEGNAQLGGLATYFNFGEFWWDRFYHCILTSDSALLSLVDDLGLTEELAWTTTKVGFFADEKLYSMSSSLDFLRFRPLNLWQKARLAAGILYTCQIKDGHRLEGELASEWLAKVFGRTNYEKMWGPLLKCKLGACREQASAAFIWATITRLYSTREKSSRQQERLGYVRGGYRTVFSHLVDAIEQLGGSMVTNAPVKQIQSTGDALEVDVKGTQQRFDRVIATVPSHRFAEMTPALSREYVRRLKETIYLGIVCVVLVLRRRLSPFYVTNLADENFPFTGIIEMTNLISDEETEGNHLVYLPKYTSPNDPLFEASDDQVWQQFEAHLRRVIPDFQSNDIKNRFTFRERLVQPVPTLHYSEAVPTMETGIPGLILANTTQIVNSTLNNNAMIGIARQAVEIALKPIASVAQKKQMQPALA